MRTKKQERVVKKCMKAIYNMVKIASNYKHLDTKHRYQIHHMLLEVIPETEVILNANGFEYTDEVTKTIKDVADRIIPRCEFYQ